MNPGDMISIHMSDAPAPGGGDAFEVVISDLTTRQTGFMQASAANGFMTTSTGRLLRHAVQLPAGVSTPPPRPTSSAGRCSRPTSAPSSRPVTSSRAPRSPTRSPTVRRDRHGRDVQPVQRPVRERGTARQHHAETSDAMCYNKGDTHPGYDGPGTSQRRTRSPTARTTSPRTATWTSTAARTGRNGRPACGTNLYPSSFLEQFPTTNGRQYSQFFFQTDIALSEATCTPPTPCPAARCRRRDRAGSTPTGRKVQAAPASARSSSATCPPDSS